MTYDYSPTIHETQAVEYRDVVANSPGYELREGAADLSRVTAALFATPANRKLAEKTERQIPSERPTIEFAPAPAAALAGASRLSKAAMAEIREERSRLSKLSFERPLSPSEQRRKRYLEWQINTEELAQLEADLGGLEKLAVQYEKLTVEVWGLVDALKSQEPSVPKGRSWRR